MIVKTFSMFAILFFVENSKGLLDFTDDKYNVTKLFENYNFTCHIGLNEYINRNLYNPIDLEDTDLEHTDHAYIDKIEELKTTYFNLLRVYYITYGISNKMNTIIAPTMWSEYMLMWNWNLDYNKSKLRNMAKNIILNIGANNLTLGDHKIITIYEHCRKTLSSLSLPSQSMRNNLTDIIIDHATSNYSEKKISNVKYLLPAPVPLDYGFILLLIEEGEIENFFDSGPVHQIKFIVNLMNQAIINSYDTVNKIYNGLDSINKDMLNILKEMHLCLINATEVVHYIQRFQRQKNIKVNLYSDTTELIQKCRIYMKNLEARLMKEPYVSDHIGSSNYSGRLVEYKENKHTIRVPVMGYYMNKPGQEEFEILNKNIEENEYYELLMELRIWIIMIQNFAHKMKVERFDDIDFLGPHLKYLTEMKMFFEEEREKIKQYEILFNLGLLA